MLFRLITINVSQLRLAGIPFKGKNRERALEITEWKLSESYRGISYKGEGDRGTSSVSKSTFVFTI